jgi:hypothetical protein
MEPHEQERRLLFRIEDRQRQNDQKSLDGAVVGKIQPTP